MRRRRLRKKTKIKNDSDSIPPDIVIEIVKRLPVKVVSTFLLVSKLWLTIIRSTDFIRSFPFPPSIQHQPPRLLFALNSFDNQSGQHNMLFYLSEEEKPTLSFLSRTQCQIPNRCHCDVHYVNGLISLGYGQQQIITNPSTGKSIYLPKVKSRKKIIQSFFGYDPITLGGEGRVEQSWRLIECNTPHCPKNNGLCINGVLYYGAFTCTDMMEWCLVRFDVKTGKLDLLSGLNEISVQSFRPSLINYQGKVTLAFEISLHTFDLWVMEDAENLQKWSKIRFSIRPWMYPFGDDALRIRGTIHSGEIIIVPYDCGERRLGLTHVLYYDCKNNKLRVRNVHYKYMKNQYPLRWLR